MSAPYVAPEPMTLEQAEEFFAVIFHGKHHIPADVKPFGRGWKVSCYSGRLATFDFNDLTRLVLLAHDRCVRVELIQAGPGRIGIGIWQRGTREGCMSERHPTIETALADWRKAHPIESVTA